VLTFWDIRDTTHSEFIYVAKTYLTGPIKREEGILAAMSYQKPEALTLLWQVDYLTIKNVGYNPSSAP